MSKRNLPMPVIAPGAVTTVQNPSVPTMMASLSQFSPEKKQKQVGRFREKDKYGNEVTLKFDDGQEYYVATDFLKMASPVFTKMLESDFKEKETMVIKLKGKHPDDFLALLDFLHPAVQKRITEDTVFRIIPLAEEYCITKAVTDCRKKLINMLRKLDQKDKYGNYITGKLILTSHCDTLTKCLEILDISITFSYTDIEELATSIISKFPSKAYLGEDGQDKQQNVNKRCIEKYSNLPEKNKNKLLQTRLNQCEDKYSMGLLQTL